MLFITFCSLFFSALYSACGDETVSTVLNKCRVMKLSMSSDQTVTITSSGSIIVDDHDNGGLIQLPASTSNLTITNDGTLQVGQYDGVGSETGGK